MDDQNGGFTVFGHIVNADGLAVMDAIAALPTTNAGTGTPFDQLPVINYTQGAAPTAGNLVQVQAIPAFFNGAALLGNGAYYLAFAMATRSATTRTW